MEQKLRHVAIQSYGCFWSNRLPPKAPIDAKYTKDGAKFKLEPNKKQSANHPKLPPNTEIDAKYIQDAQTKFFLS